MNNREAETSRSWIFRRFAVVVGVLFAPSLADDSIAADGLPSDAVVKQHALLIGVTTYPHLGERYQLLGPSNDVALVSHTLRSSFGFSRENIVALTEKHGADNAHRLPTRENIEREFQNLAQRVRQGDQVVVYLAGHGSQQPASDESENREQDGLDEIFLPRDVGQWNGASGKVERAISDNQIATWISQIRQRQASVWLIVDACHSGTLLRSVDERVRQVSAESADGLNIPRSVLRRAESAAHEPETTTDLTPSSFKIGSGSGVAAIYACLPDEVTVERTMPRGSQDARHHGLLTYTLCKVLGQVALSGRSLTYQELTRRIRSEYSAMGRRFPSPLAEGSNLDQPILGRGPSESRTNIKMVDPNRLNAGTLQGLTVGTVLSFASAAQPDRAIGHVEVVETNALGSEIETRAYNDLPEVGEIPTDALFRVVYRESTDDTIRIALDQVDRRGIRLTEKMQQAWLERIRPLEQIDSRVRIAVNSAGADWLLRPSAEGVYLVRASEAVSDSSKDSVAHFGPLPADDRLVDQLAAALRTIARAENLKRLAADAGGRFLSPRDAVALDIELRRRHDRQDVRGQYALDWQQGGLELHDGDRIAIHVTNPNRFAIDLNLFYIDSDYGITALYPVEGEFNRLAHGETTSIRCRLAASSNGAEHLVVIGVRAGPERADLSGLAQAGLDRADESQRSIASNGPGVRSPLARLLRSALQPDGATRTRGIRRDEVDDYVIELISWHINNGRRTAAE